MSFTEAQNQAIESTGNVLLVAGAGAGKTKTLVEKCIRYLTDEKNKGSLDRVLMVTFTEAAAKEVRERIQAMLESRLNLDQGSQHLQEQLAKLDQAHISTLHGFCNYLVRKYILDLNLSPSFRICTDKTQQSIIEKTFESLFEELEGDPESEPFFTQYCEGGEKTFKSLILKLFFYSQSQPFPEAWLKGLQENIQSLETWKNLLKDQWLKQREVWRDLARRYDSPKSTDIYNALNKVQDSSDLSSWSAAVCHLDQLTKEAPTDIRVGKSYTRACQDLAFIYQLTGSEGDDFKQLSQDYALHSQSIRAVTKICLTFHKLYQKAKREQGFLDFSDLEQYALQLLWDHDRKKPSELACELRNDFDLIFVDEFQDINKVQDTIIRAISIPETGKGLFLVGDVKQSIYRFRLADPTIFLDYQDHWKTLDSQHGKVISLQENFRSHETILHFVNDIFQHFMKSPVGGIEYDQDAELRFSDGGNRSHFKKRIFPEEVQIQTWAKDKSGPVTDPETGEETENPGELIVESRNVAQTIRGLVQSGYPIFESDGSSRPVKFEDIAILVSSKKAVIEPLAREFAAAGVPLYAVAGDLFASMECFDLLNLLKLIDNSEQDIPLIGLLRSPLVGMSVDELARISLHGKGDSFWIRCQNFRLTSPKLLESITEKLNSFFNKLDGWKSQCPYLSVPELLELILSETHYLWWLQTQSRKEQRLANVQKFQQLASQFESEQKGTLYQFLQSIEDQEEIGVVEEPPAIASDNSVQLMTIHQSKGLEFPVVFLPFLGRKWNLSNMNDKLQIDPEMGLCLHIRPPGLSGAYPSFLQFVAKNNERLAQVGEELRKFYVALTRAKQKLYLSGSVSKAFEDRAADISWPPATDDILNATSTAEWVHAWVSNAQSSKLLSVPIPNWGDSNSRMQDSAVISKPVTDEDFRSLQSSHAWKYRGEELTEQPAKTSVTQLKNRASIEISEASPFQKRRKPFIRTGPDAIERGKAFHLVLETMSLNQGVSLKRLREHVEKLVNEKALTREEADSVHLENVVRFWQTMEGSFALLHHAQVRRELPFTYRLSLQDYNRLLGEETTSAQEAEFVVLQGIIDLTVITDSEIYIVDFKTDKIPNQQILSEKITNYGPQLSLYKRALEEIYKKPVIWTALHFLETGYTHVVSDPVPV